MKKMLGKFLRDEEGASIVEYAVVIAFIAMAMVVVLNTFQGKLSGTFNASGDKIQQSF